MKERYGGFEEEGSGFTDIALESVQTSSGAYEIYEYATYVLLMW